jgi:hypothetical protein
LVSLCTADEESGSDFFTTCLSIKLKARQKALKTLESKLLDGQFKTCLKSFSAVVLPVVNYLVFGGKTQNENRRNTISYDKD